jgi:hypothetical protein
MVRFRLTVTAALVVGFVAAAVPRADVKTQQKSLVKFEGTLGSVVGLFGGKAAKEGLVTSVAVKGNRKATMSESGGQIVDLTEEKVYDLDLRNKTYKVTTFAELRKQMEEARARAEQDARKAQQNQKKDPNQREYEVDFTVKDTGQARTINGFDCKQQIATITVREKGKTLEQAGGIVMTVDSWLAPKQPALAEVMDFERRYFEKLGGSSMFGSPDQMAAAMAIWPGMKEALAKYQAEGSTKLTGTPVQTTMKIEGVQSQEQAAQQAKDDEKPAGGMGGMLGGLGKRLGKKKSDEGDQAAPSATKGRSTILTMDNEVLSVSTSVSPDDVAIPAGFKQR